MTKPIKPKDDKRKQYEEYLNEIGRRNFDIDMYDGDTYMPNITPMTFEEFCDDL